MHNVRAEMQAFYKETASKSKGGGWRAVGAKIGKSGAYARQIAEGQKPVTEEIAVAWMLSNGWEPKTYSYPPCPGCGGEPHVAREGCNGNGGTAIVLAPGETVMKRKPRQYSRIADMPVSMLARAIRERETWTT